MNALGELYHCIPWGGMQEDYKARIMRALAKNAAANRPKAPRAPSTGVTEYHIQVACAKVLRVAERQLGIKWMHCPNEGTRTAVAGARLRTAGMQRGFPDLIIFHRALPGGYAVMELKTETGKLSPSQADWMGFFAAQGCIARTTYGMDEALAVLQQILDQCTA